MIDQHTSLLASTLQQYGRRIRDRGEGGLSAWVVLAHQDTEGVWHYQNARDETVLTLARNIYRVDRRDLATFRAELLTNRGDDRLVFVRLSSPRKLEAWSVKIGEPN